MVLLVLIIVGFHGLTVVAEGAVFDKGTRLHTLLSLAALPLVLVLLFLLVLEVDKLLLLVFFDGVMKLANESVDNMEVVVLVLSDPVLLVVVLAVVLVLVAVEILPIDCFILLVL